MASQIPHFEPMGCICLQNDSTLKNKVAILLLQTVHYLHNQAQKDRHTDLARRLRVELSQCEGDCSASASMDGVQTKDLSCSSAQKLQINMRRSLVTI